jgi:hypothetical protein
LALIFDDKNDIIDQANNHYFVIDGANIAYEVKTKDNKPKISNLLMTINKLDLYGILKYKIICDRALFYRIDDQKSYKKHVKEKRIIETPEGTPADIFILQLAHEKNAFIISNDKFKNFYPIFEKKWIIQKRISFRIIEEDIFFDKLIIK